MRLEKHLKMDKKRLDTFLANENIGSRKDVKKRIQAGCVVVNDKVIRKSDFKVSSDDVILVDGVRIKPSGMVYYMLNKPKDVVSANIDNLHPTARDLILDYKKDDLFSIGRLDIDTTGLLLFTNDGLLSHRLRSPKYAISKTYEVTFSGEFKDTFIDDFKHGITLDDGYRCLSANLEYISSNKARLTIQEGKFHQVKRMFKAVSLEVVLLKRISFGEIDLDMNLVEGEYRRLSDDEVLKLKKSVNI